MGWDPDRIESNRVADLVGSELGSAIVLGKRGRGRQCIVGGSVMCDGRHVVVVIFEGMSCHIMSDSCRISCNFRSVGRSMMKEST